jgi:hypothetical protein
MSENPYQPPMSSQAMPVHRPQVTPELRIVAVWQKRILLCILFQIIAVVATFFSSAQITKWVIAGIVVISVVSVVCVFFLAIRVYGVALGLAMALLSIVPYVGLLVLCVINAKATRLLKGCGFKVGLMGAKLSEFD